jgi:hypothetical protein
MAAKGYQSISSFHSDRVYDVLHAASPASVLAAGSHETTSGLPALGDADGWRAEFLLDPAPAFLNHGAFGCALRRPFEHAERTRRRVETRPVEYMDREALPGIAQSTRCLAEFLNVDRDTVVLFPNATSAINSAMFRYANTEAWYGMDGRHPLVADFNPVALFGITSHRTAASGLRKRTPSSASTPPMAP